MRGLYTGSAADYERPSLHYVGTGEGNQVYGWGLYASDRRGKAEMYAEAQKNKKSRPVETRLFLDGRTADEYDADSDSRTHYILQDIEWAGGVGAYEAELGGDIGRFRNEVERLVRLREERNAPGFALLFTAGDADRLRAAETSYRRAVREKEWLDAHRDGLEFREVGGPASEHLYEQTWFTDRAPGDESRLLDWFKEISDGNWERILAQAGREELRVRFAKFLGELGESLEEYLTYEGRTNRAVYGRLSLLLDGQRAASEFLARAGIDGVKYPVDSYGGRENLDGAAGWNYVSFRDDNVRVDHKWTDGEQRFSVRANPRLREEVEAALNTDRERGDVLKGGRRIDICEAPALFREIGIPDGTVYTKAHTLRKIFQNHGLTAGQIASTPELIANPAAVLDDNGEGYIFLTDALAPDRNGRMAPVMVYLRPDGDGNYIASEYSRTEDAESKYINLTNAGGLLYADKDKVARLPLRGEALSSLSTFNAGDRAEASGDESPSESARIVPQTGVAAQGGGTRHRVFIDENAPATSVTDLTTAFLAQRILAGKKVSVGGAERVLKNVGGPCDAAVPSAAPPGHL